MNTPRALVVIISAAVGLCAIGCGEPPADVPIQQVSGAVTSTSDGGTSTEAGMPGPVASYTHSSGICYDGVCKCGSACANFYDSACTNLDAVFATSINCDSVRMSACPESGMETDNADCNDFCANHSNCPADTGCIQSICPS